MNLFLNKKNFELKYIKGKLGYSQCATAKLRHENIGL